LRRLFGDAAIEAFPAPYSLGNVQNLRSLFSDAGVPDIEITSLEGKARYPSIRCWMEAEIKGWTLADVIDDKEFELLVSEAETELAHFVTTDGRVEFRNPAHIVIVIKHAV
jgi:hypothetical protein